MKKNVPLCKQSKKAQHAYHNEKRGSWNGLSPVTRVISEKNKYSRQKSQVITQDFME